MRINCVLLCAAIGTAGLHAGTRVVRLPLHFEPSANRSTFVGRAGGASLLLTPTTAEIHGGTMQLVGGSGTVQAQPEGPLNGYTNYLMAGDPAQWRTHVRNYSRIRYQNVYPGIDIVYYGSDRQLEFDFIVQPRANPKDIRLSLSSPRLQIRLPRVYQGDHEIPGRAVRHGNRVTFDIADYDHSQPLVIDPVLSYAAVFGGGGQDGGRAIAVDSTGATYVVGIAFDGNFPVVNGTSTQTGSFIAKVNASGDGLVYSTYLPLPVGFILNGGGPANIAVDPSGNIYFASPNFGGVIASAPNGSPIPILGPPPLGPCTVNGPPLLYVAKLKSDGASLVYSGCVPGSTPGGPGVVAADASGNAYFTGWAQSSDFPLVNPLPNPPLVNPGPPRPFLLKLGPDGKLLYSTLFGSKSGGDVIEAITADPAGNIYLAGQTSSPDFPIKNAILPRPPSFNSPFVTKIKADGSDYVYSTYFGGSNFDAVLAIAADASGHAYLAGSTTSGNFPVTTNAFGKQFDGTFLYRSTDGAKSWSRSDSGLSAPALFVQVDPHQPATIYAVSGGGLFKSIDRGASWSGTAAAAVSSLWIDPADSTLFIGTTHGDLVRSRDGGTTFVPLASAPGGNLNEMVFDPTNASVIYARWGGHGPTDGVYKSIDGGDTWKLTGLSGAMTGSGPLAIDPANPTFLYAESRSRGLVKSLDGGDTWTDLGGDVSQIVVDSNSTLYSTTGSVIHVLPLHGSTVDKLAPGPVGVLLIDPASSSTWYVTAYAATGPSVFKTIDSGDTWQQVTTGLPNLLNATSLVLDPSTPQTLYLGSSPNSDGFFAKFSADGTSLEYSTYLGGTGVDTSTAIAIDSAGNAYVAGRTNSIDFPRQAAFRQSGSGFAAMFDATGKLGWSSLLGGADPAAAALGPKGELYLTGSASSNTFSTSGALGPFVSGQVFRTTNAGITWTGNMVASNPQLQASAVAIDPKSPSHVFALADRLYGSSDGGQTWSQLGSPLPPPFTGGYGGLVKLIVDPFNSSTLYVPISLCSAINGVTVGCGISKSTDGGLTWTLDRVATPPPNQPPIFVLDLAISPKTTSIHYAAVQQPPQPNGVATAGGIYKSTDGGVTWNITGLVNNTVAVAVDPQNPSIAYTSIGPTSLDPRTGLSNSLGLFKSSDGGATWTAINTGLPSGWFAVNLTADPSIPQRIYAVGYSNTGLYRSDDGGNHWTALGPGLPNSSINAIALDPTNSATVYVAPSAGGLYRSVNAGANWSQVPGLRVPIINSIAVDPSNSSRIYAGTQPNPGDAFVMKIVP